MFSPKSNMGDQGFGWNKCTFFTVAKLICTGWGWDTICDASDNSDIPNANTMHQNKQKTTFVFFHS